MTEKKPSNLASAVWTALIMTIGNIILALIEKLL